tara:strand:- start:1784 stop:4405 length:2622 start_codon:yes stop_codon:yes gene_type:complete
MSRFVGERNAELIIAAAQQWKEKCALAGGSILSVRQLWTVQNIAALDQHFVNNPLEGEGDFFSKLESQLEPTAKEVKQLAAEMLWLMLLCPSNISAGKKLENVQLIWSWSGQELDPDQPLLSKETLTGVGSAGTSFNTNRWRELVYLIQICKQLFVMSQPQRIELFSDGWRFAEWLQTIEDSDARQLRHMLLFMLFPDTFERIFGGTDRKAISVFFTDKTKSQINRLSALELDRQLSQIRQEQEAELGSKELDFYVPPLSEQWRDRKAKHWLFSWNPKNWIWDELPAALDAIKQGKTVTERWNCNNQQVTVGDKAWLVRLGTPPKGIMAVGNVITEPYEDAHWDADKAAAGQTCQYVDIEFSRIIDVFKDNFVTEQDLNIISVDKQNWWPQSSGIEIQKRSAGILEQLWGKLSKPAVTAKESAPVIAEPINQILYGPPGTGKTYHLNKLKEKYSSSAEPVSREQWLSDQLLAVRWFDVVFLALYARGGKAKVGEMASHEFVVQKAKAVGRAQHIKQQIWASLQTHAMEASETVKYAKRQSPFVFDKDPNSTWSLQGDWKEECEELLAFAETLKLGPQHQKAASRFEFVTFHQAYSYEDFVEGIRPIQDEDSGELIYRVIPGVFRRICQRAENDPSHRYAIFIDEINRGNIAKIFGELITLIEPDKRTTPLTTVDPAQGMRLTLPYSGDAFGVPKNLDIYGTMNTADRSISLLDTALRRRFQFKELMPDSGLINGSRGDGYIEDGEGGVINLRDMLDAMNKRIRFLLNRDLMLGHAYLSKVRTFSDLKTVILNQFVPLLQEYFYDDWHRIQLVFRDVGSAGEPLEPQIIVHETLTSENVLGFDHDDFDELADYRVAPPEEITPDAMRKIYESAG